MKHLQVLTLAIFAALLSCTDSKTPNAKTFEAAINQSLGKHRRCVVNHMSMLPSSPMNDNPGYDALVDAGMLSKSPAPGVVQSRFIYDLTSSGKATKMEFIDGYGGPDTGYLCSGTLTVDKVIDFTQPAASTSTTESKVTYVTKFVDTPDWAKNPGVARYWNSIEPVPTRPGQTESTTLVLTNDGWKVKNDG